MSWIQTYTGRKFDFSDPQPEMVFIDDIAHALANVCRYAGHCRKFYSVAQHSIYVCSQVGAQHKLQALLHDATEAYVVDMPRPLKQMLPAYQEIEARVWRAIATRFRVPEKLAPEVKFADNLMLMTERGSLLGPRPEPWAPELEAITPLPMWVNPWAPRDAETRFLAEFKTLTGASTCQSGM